MAKSSGLLLIIWNKHIFKKKNPPSISVKILLWLLDRGHFQSKPGQRDIFRSGMHVEN